MRFSRPRFFYGLVKLARSLVPIAVVLPLAAIAAGCVAHRGYTPVGAGQVTSSGHAASGAPGAGTAALAPTVAVPGDLPDADLRVDYQLWLPRAMEVRWQVRCAEVVVEGEAGETFEAYKVRRLAELAAERERARRNAAQVGSIVGGALLGQQAVTASAGGPNANAQAGVAVDGSALGAAAGAATVSTEVALAPDDVGQGYRRGHVELAAVPAGACTMDVAPLVRAPAADGAPVVEVAAIDPALLTGTFRVSRRDDPARRRALVAERGAIEVRGSLRASLVATGADADVEAARARNRARAEAAEAARIAAYEADRARAQAALELRLDAEARVRFEAQLRFDAAMSTRGAVIAYLGRCGGDPYRRERLAEEARVRARLELELTARRQRIAFDLRGHLHASLIAAGADPGLRARLLEEAARDASARDAARAEADAAAQAEAYRQAMIAAELRGRVSASLVADGAVMRPPMPALVDENPPPPPLADAVWIGGSWIWSGVRWEWSSGQWLGGTPIGAGITVTIGGGASIPPVPAYDPPPPPPAYDPPSRPAPPRPVVVDHRTPVAAPPPAPPPPPARPARPKKRDHRDGH